MRKFILTLIFLFICVACLAQERYIITPETHDVLEPFHNELLEFMRDIPKSKDDVTLTAINFLRSTLDEHRIGLYDICCMLFIEETHSEHTKESIDIKKLRIKAEISNIDDAIETISHPKRSSI